MLCDVNYDVRRSSYIFPGFQYIWPFVFGMLQNIFQTPILAIKPTQTHVYDIRFYVTCVHIREMGANLLHFKCQTFTGIGLVTSDVLTVRVSFLLPGASYQGQRITNLNRLFSKFIGKLTEIFFEFSSS